MVITLILAKTMTSLKYSRIVLLCKTGLQYKIELDRMSEDISSIWLKVGGRGRKSLLIGGVYREHTLIKQPDPNTSNEKVQQERRWFKFIDQWKAASGCGPCMVIGDINLDLQKWMDPSPFQENMVDAVKNEITTRNVHQMIRGPTRFWVGVQPSLLDHCWSNMPEKIFNIKNMTRGTGDHNVISLSYRLSGSITSKMETRGRDRRNFCEEEFKRRLNLVNWEPVFNAQNADVATYEFESRFIQILEELAPMRKTQPRRRRTDWISQRTKKIMKDWDTARDTAVGSNQVEDCNIYKELRNNCNKKVKSDRRENLKEKYENLNKNKDSKGLFRLTKQKMGWKAGGSPEAFLVDGRMMSNPKKMADLQVLHYQNKIKNQIDEVTSNSC